MKGELLQELRRDKGLSQKQLGALLSVSPFTISSYECGHSDPDDEAKVKLAKIFDISLDYLLGLVREPCSYRRDASYIYGAMSTPFSFRPIFRRRRCSWCASSLPLCSIRKRHRSTAPGRKPDGAKWPPAAFPPGRGPVLCLAPHLPASMPRERHSRAAARLVASASPKADRRK